MTYFKENQSYVIKYYKATCPELKMEHHVMSQLTHPNVMSMIRLVIKKEVLHIGIMMKRETETLSDHIEREQNLSKEQKFNYLRQIAKGIKFLHENEILHLDLKLDNMMITDAQIKIIDFGSAEFMVNGYARISRIKTTVTHRPPEGFGYDATNGFFEVNDKFDVWSFGIMMYEIMTGVPMYMQDILPMYLPEYYENFVSGRDYDWMVYQCITNSEFIGRIGKIIPKDFMDCLSLEAENRPEMSDILERLV